MSTSPTHQSVTTVGDARQWTGPLPDWMSDTFEIVSECLGGAMMDAVVVGAEALLFPARRHGDGGPGPAVASAGAVEVPRLGIVAATTRQIEVFSFRGARAQNGGQQQRNQGETHS